jgi:hypothetical protein
MAVRAVKKGFFRFEGKLFVVIEVTGGAVELYSVVEHGSARGLEEFIGYWHEAKIPGSLRLKAAEVLYGGGILEFSISYQMELPLAA